MNIKEQVKELNKTRVFILFIGFLLGAATCSYEYYLYLQNAIHGGFFISIVTITILAYATSFAYIVGVMGHKQGLAIFDWKYRGIQTFIELNCLMVFAATAHRYWTNDQSAGSAIATVIGITIVTLFVTFIVDGMAERRETKLKYSRTGYFYPEG